MRHIATFCGDCSCGCPQLFVDDTAAPERAVVITDDFGQRIQMSLTQLGDLIPPSTRWRLVAHCRPRVSGCGDHHWLLRLVSGALQGLDVDLAHAVTLVSLHSGIRQETRLLSTT